MDELIKVLKELHNDIDFASHEHLIDEKVLNSFDIAMLIVMISDNFNVTIEPEDIVPENFNSAKTLWALIENLKD